MSMIMWELTSNEYPFSNNCHDINFALAVLNGLRPEITKETPKLYAEIMKRCWSSDPSQRPDASTLPELFEELKKLCNNGDDNTALPNHALYKIIGMKYIKYKICMYYN